MKYTVTLKRNNDFRRLYSKGRFKASPLLVIYCRKNRLGLNRVGITVGAKLGHAVRRNRIRRRVREIYRLNEGRFTPGYDMVVVVRGKALDADFKKLTATYLSLADSLGLLRPQSKTE